MAATSKKPESTSQAHRVAAARHLPLRKKLVFAAVTIVVFFCFAELACFFAGFKPQRIRTDPFVGFASHVPLFEDSGSPSDSVEIAENKLPWFNNQSFRRSKP